MSLNPYHRNKTNKFNFEYVYQAVYFFLVKKIKLFSSLFLFGFAIFLFFLHQRKFYIDIRVHAVTVHEMPKQRETCTHGRSRDLLTELLIIIIIYDMCIHTEWR